MVTRLLWEQASRFESDVFYHPLVLLWVHVILPFTKQTLAANLYNRGLQVRVLWMQLCILAEMVYAFDLKSN